MSSSAGSGTGAALSDVSLSAFFTAGESAIFAAALAKVAGLGGVTAVAEALESAVLSGAFAWVAAPEVADTVWLAGFVAGVEVSVSFPCDAALPYAASAGVGAAGSLSSDAGPCSFTPTGSTPREVAPGPLRTGPGLSLIHI